MTFAFDLLLALVVIYATAYGCFQFVRWEDKDHAKDQRDREWDRAAEECRRAIWAATRQTTSTPRSKP